jgi:hypothetical protein
VIRSWTAMMFFWSVLGSLAALFWPWLIAIWRKESNEFFRWVGPEVPAAGRSIDAEHLPGPPILRLFLKLVILIASPFVLYFPKALGIAIVAIVIACISAAVGFFSFLNNQPNQQQNLMQLGALAYFAAFNYGFTSASLVEEALKGRGK